LRDGIRDETLAILKAEQTAVLLVTHEPEEAMRMADEIALMRDGRIVQSGAPYNIYNAPSDQHHQKSGQWRFGQYPFWTVLGPRVGGWNWGGHCVSAATCSD